MSKYQPFLNLNIHINVTHIPASKQVQCRWIFHCQTITVGTPMIFPTIPNVEIWFHIFLTFFFLFSSILSAGSRLVTHVSHFIDQLGPMDAGLCWVPRLPALASHTTGQFEGSPPLGDQRHKQEREREVVPPNSKRNNSSQTQECNPCQVSEMKTYESAPGIITQKILFARNH